MTSSGRSRPLALRADGGYRDNSTMPEGVHPDGRAHLDAALAKRLIAAQFPQWSGLSVVPAIDKEHRWLPVLAPRVPVEIPVCLAKGQPGDGFPYNWSVRRWIIGDTADHAHIPEEAEFATQAGEFLRALQRVDPTGGPVASVQSFYRGAPPAHYDGETRHALEALAGRIDTASAAAVWAADIDTDAQRAAINHRVIQNVLADYERST